MVTSLRTPQSGAFRPGALRPLRGRLYNKGGVGEVFTSLVTVIPSVGHSCTSDEKSLWIYLCRGARTVGLFPLVTMSSEESSDPPTWRRRSWNYSKTTARSVAKWKNFLVSRVSVFTSIPARRFGGPAGVSPVSHHRPGLCDLSACWPTSARRCTLVSAWM